MPTNKLEIAYFTSNTIITLAVKSGNSTGVHVYINSFVNTGQILNLHYSTFIPDSNELIKEKCEKPSFLF